MSHSALRLVHSAGPTRSSIPCSSKETSQFSSTSSTWLSDSLHELANLAQVMALNSPAHLRQIVLLMRRINESAANNGRGLM